MPMICWGTEDAPSRPRSVIYYSVHNVGYKCSPRNDAIPMFPLCPRIGCLDACSTSYGLLSMSEAAADIACLLRKLGFTRLKARSVSAVRGGTLSLPASSNRAPWPRKSMYCILRGQRWRIRFDVNTRSLRYLGTCGDPRAKREIIIHGRQGEAIFLSTLIHEALHACFFDLREEVVELLGRKIAGLLVQLGYGISPRVGPRPARD